MLKFNVVELKIFFVKKKKKKKGYFKGILLVLLKLRYWEYMLYVLGENIVMKSIRVGLCLMDRSRGV